QAADDGRGGTGVDGVLTERGSDRADLGHLQVDGQATGPQDQRYVRGLVQRPDAGDLAGVADAALERRGGDDDVVEDDRHTPTQVAAREGPELGRALGPDVELNDGAPRHAYRLPERGRGVGHDLACEGRRLQVSERELLSGDAVRVGV